MSGKLIIYAFLFFSVLEYIGPKHRTLVANLSIAIYFTLGTVLIPWISYAVKDWRLANTLSSLTMILATFAFWFLPESARWLSSRGKNCYLSITMLILIKILIKFLNFVY